MDNKLIAEIDRALGDKICVQLGEYKGKKWVDLRVFFYDDNFDLKPTKKGVTIPAVDLPCVIQALVKAQNELNQVTVEG